MLVGPVYRSDVHVHANSACPLYVWLFKFTGCVQLWIDTPESVPRKLFGKNKDDYSVREVHVMNWPRKPGYHAVVTNRSWSWYFWTYRPVKDAAAIQLLRKPDLTERELKKYFTVVPFYFWINLENWKAILLKTIWNPIYLKFVSSRWYYCIDYSLQTIYISVKMCMVDITFWNEDFGSLGWRQNWCVLWFHRSTIWWSDKWQTLLVNFLQKIWFPTFKICWLSYGRAICPCRSSSCNIWWVLSPVWSFMQVLILWGKEIMGGLLTQKSSDVPRKWNAWLVRRVA